MTVYRRIYHVSANHSEADDRNEGTAKRPWKTLGRAAEVLCPGEKVVVHAGTYRECLRPARGGEGPDRMIAYEAAPGEEVILTGSESWRPKAVPSEGWRLGRTVDGVRPPVWMADLPVAAFHAYNPFLARNIYDHVHYFGNLADREWTARALLRRGAVFWNGQPLRQVMFARDLAAQDGAFWVEEPGERIHFRLPGDHRPDEGWLEISAREQVFAPRTRGLGYIRVSGFTLRHAADGVPVPQRALLSTARGHHWIIENNTIEWANACGIDLGMESWDAETSVPCGGHVVRRNLIRYCGICGIAGFRGVEHSLIEENLLEHIGRLNLEHACEAAAIKFHFAKSSLIRGNVLRHLDHCGGLWLDVDNENCRVTGNVFQDIVSFTGGVYSEMNFGLNWIDNNVFWDIRSNAQKAGGPILPEGSAIRADCNERLVVAHNFFGKIEAYAVAFTLVQAARMGEERGRTGLCRANVALNNVFWQCPHRISLGRREENVCDGNVYDRREDRGSFEIRYPEPGCRQDLAGWQDYFNLDRNSRQEEMEAEFDAARGRLKWQISGTMPPVASHPAFPRVGRRPGPQMAIAVSSVRKRKTRSLSSFSSASFGRRTKKK
jgi:hypothetical protein